MMCSGMSIKKASSSSVSVVQICMSSLLTATCLTSLGIGGGVSIFLVECDSYKYTIKLFFVLFVM